MSARQEVNVDEIAELVFNDSESEWSDSEDADNDEMDGCKDSSTNGSVGNDKMNYWNELCDVQLGKQVNLEPVPDFTGTQGVRGLTGLSPF
jgi:hypothetical protein